MANNESQFRKLAREFIRSEQNFKATGRPTREWQTAWLQAQQRTSHLPPDVQNQLRQYLFAEIETVRAASTQAQRDRGTNAANDMIREWTSSIGERDGLTLQQAEKVAKGHHIATVRHLKEGSETYKEVQVRPPAPWEKVRAAIAVSTAKAKADELEKELTTRPDARKRVIDERARALARAEAERHGASARLKDQDGRAKPSLRDQLTAAVEVTAEEHGHQEFNSAFEQHLPAEHPTLTGDNSTTDSNDTEAA